MNHSVKTRLLAMILAVVMVIGYVPVSAFAAENVDESAAPETVTVAFDVNGGVGEYEDQVVTAGEKVAKPEQDPTHESSQFAYWTADLEEPAEWNFENAVEEDMTLYAAWAAPAAAANEDGTEDTTEGTNEDTTEGTNEDTTEGTNEDTTEGTDEDTSEGTNEDTTEGTNEDTSEGTNEDTTEETTEETSEGTNEDTSEGANEDTTEGTTEGETAEPVKYTVKYYVLSWDPDEKELVAEEEMTGIPGEMTDVQEKEFEDLILFDDIVQVEIAADGSTVVEVFYIRQTEEAGLYDAPGLSLGFEAGNAIGTNGYYNVITAKNWNLVPNAAEEYEVVLNNANGNRRQVIHVIEVDPSNPDVSIVPGYNQIDKDLENEANWSHKELTEMAKYYEDQLGYNVVGGMNTDLYYSSYSPRVLVYNGKWIGNAGENVATGGAVLGYTSSILYVFKDAEGNVSCDVKAFSKADVDKYLADGTLLHAVGVSFAMVVKDGALVTTKESRGSDDAARSMVGVKPDGTLVICMNDGRGANNSVGFSSYEEGEIMLALGCKWAANCDGGGSSTFLTKRAGEETFEMRSVPCDGAQRPTAHGVFVVSNVAPTNELDVVNVESDYDIFAPNTAYTFGAKAIDTHGYAMDMPADASWALSDASFGTIAGGEFVSNGKQGTVDVQVISGDKVVGSKTITVADPKVFKLSATSTVVPYSTAEKIRTITLPIVAKTGEANVYVDTNAVTVSLSDEAAGTLDGFNFTTTSDTSIAGVNVTIAYGETVLTYAIEFGKGSEIIFDFEDGSRAGFMGFEEAKEWSQNNGVNNTLVGSDPLAGQFNEYLSSDTFMATTGNGGQVRNGNYALAWRLDNTDADFANWSYNVLFNTSEETIVLRDVANDMKATTLGMWLYIPEGAPGLAFQSQLYVKNADGSYSCKQDHFMFTSAATGKLTNLNSATEADIPESRWVYASIDISKYDYLCMPVAADEGNSRSPSFVRTYVKPTAPAELTFYIDDITLDYSSAVDDRVLPEITEITYSTADVAVTLNNGASVTGEKIAFSAKVADKAALDYSTGKIYLDGVSLDVSASGGILSTKGDATLLPGAHTVTFEIKDELGNPRKVTRTFTATGDAAVELSGHNDSGETPKAQSVYYVDIKVADLTSVNKVVAQLKLNNANTWETKGAIVANGFEATFDYNEVSELLTVTVEGRTNTRSADNVLISIPVRTWTWDRYDYVAEKYVAVGGNMPVVNIVCDVVYGTVNGNAFGGGINVATELTTISSPYHVHDAELTVLNKEATVEAAGYENRTYCETCKSVIDWGTIIPKVEVKHNYVIKDAQFVCQDTDCGLVLDSGTGVFEFEGVLYYSIGGKLQNNGWQDMGTYEGDDYINGGAPYTLYGYAGKDYKLYVGKHTINSITYEFAEDGTTMGAWTTNSTGTRYSVGPAFIKRSWVTLAGDQYYFGEDNYMYTGIRAIAVNRNNIKEGYRLYTFADDGKLVDDMLTVDGIVSSPADGMFYVEDGKSVYGGLMLIDGAYYYARSSGQLLTNTTYWITKTNDLLPAAYYTFGADGKMVDAPVQPDPEQPVEPEKPEVKNGIVSEDGKLWWYVDGVKTYAGLMLIDGDYYYARSSGEILTNTKYWITKNNDLLPVAYYNFGADGKMLDAPVVEPEQPDPEQPTPDPDPEQPVEPEKPAVKNGIVSEGGKLWWYVDGVKTYAGLMLIDGDYYYARSSGEILTNTKYWITKNNDLLPAANYTFGADGKMLNAPVVEPEQPTPDPDPEQPEQPEIKNGIVSEDGKLWWYVDGVKTYGGLMLIDGDYYYARSSGEILTNTKYWISKTNDLLPAAYYTFGADGKMVNLPA